MNLGKKKELASKVLDVGKGRIVFLESRLADIKEAITRQDILDLHKDGAIAIKEVVGRRKKVKRKNRRRTGKVKKKVKKDKKEYMTLTRKLRTFLKHLTKTGTIEKGDYREYRKMVRARRFRSKRQLKESLEE